jgi:hypothetical protein
MVSFDLRGDVLSLNEAITEYEEGHLTEGETINFLQSVIDNRLTESAPRSIKNAIRYYLRFGLIGTSKKRI